MSADALVIGNPYKEPLFTFGWFRIGTVSLEIEGMVISNSKNSANLPIWKRVTISFAGPLMDLISSIILIQLYKNLFSGISISINLETFVLILAILFCSKFMFSAVWNMFPKRKIVHDSEDWSEYDGYKIKMASSSFWFICMIITLAVVTYDLIELLFLWN
jgi:hypothetical protein